MRCLTRLPGHRCRQYGLSTVEFVIVLTLFSLLIGIGASYARSIAKRYEHATLEYSINQLRASMALKFADLVMRGEANSIAGLVGDNPFEWMEIKPANYQGMVNEDHYATVEPGSWIYDPRQRSVLYFGRHVGSRSTDSPRPLPIRFKVVLAETPDNTVSQLRLDRLGKGGP